VVESWKFNGYSTSYVQHTKIMNHIQGDLDASHFKWK